MGIGDTTVPRPAAQTGPAVVAGPPTGTVCSRVTALSSPRYFPEAAPRPLEAAWVAHGSRPPRTAEQQSPTRGNGSPSHRARAREVVAVTTDNLELTYFLRVRAAGGRARSTGHARSSVPASSTVTQELWDPFPKSKVREPTRTGSTAGGVREHHRERRGRA